MKNNTLEHNTDLSNMISSEGFDKLSSDDQHLLIKSLSDNVSIMEKLFGTDREKIGMFIAFWLCILLAIIGLIVWFSSKDMQIWGILIPTLTTALGFACGKSTK